MTRFDISGADLGIMWDNGQSGLNDQVLIAFGDTYGNCSVAGQEWRQNTLFRSADRNLSDGISVPDPRVRQHLRRVASHSGPAQLLQTDHRQPRPGSYRGERYPDRRNRRRHNAIRQFYVGTPVGTTRLVVDQLLGDRRLHRQRRELDRSSVEHPREFYFSVPGVWFNFGDQNFQQAAYVRNNGYVYSLGTASGRGGVAYIARVAENSITDLTQYEYYTLFGWLRGAQFFALPVIWDATSEMSVSWNDYLNKFIVLYTNAFNNVVMRTADNPEGPWSSTTTLVSSAATSGGIYAPYIHPWSSGHDLYFNLSLWSTYAVMMMHAALPSGNGPEAHLPRRLTSQVMSPPTGLYPTHMATCAASGPGMVWPSATPSRKLRRSIQPRCSTRSRCMYPTVAIGPPNPIVPSFRK